MQTDEADRSSAEDLLESAFIHRGRAEGLLPAKDSDTGVPLLSALTQTLNKKTPDFELNVIASIISEERYAQGK